MFFACCIFIFHFEIKLLGGGGGGDGILFQHALQEDSELLDASWNVTWQVDRNVSLSEMKCFN